MERRFSNFARLCGLPIKSLQQHVYLYEYFSFIFCLWNGFFNIIFYHFKIFVFFYLFFFFIVNINFFSSIEGIENMIFSNNFIPKILQFIKNTTNYLARKSDLIIYDSDIKIRNEFPSCLHYQNKSKC